MKVKIEFTVDIDAEAWRLNYGLSTAAEIRADVKEHAQSDIIEQFTILGVLE